MVPFYTPWKHQKNLDFLVFSAGIEWKHWPQWEKQVNITPPFRKGYIGSKDIYCPKSILPAIAKIFENLLSKQVILVECFSKY